MEKNNKNSNSRFAKASFLNIIEYIAEKLTFEKGKFLNSPVISERLMYFYSEDGDKKKDKETKDFIISYLIQCFEIILGEENLKNLLLKNLSLNEIIDIVYLSTIFIFCIAYPEFNPISQELSQKSLKTSYFH